uniref:Somatostatin/Cortistatin C-terminal domain-containing protein n=1 Tax=Oncorhynchus mykiss TaxID=8022 RepID=A0A8C7SYP7_ONCMY
MTVFGKPWSIDSITETYLSLTSLMNQKCLIVYQIYHYVPQSEPTHTQKNRIIPQVRDLWLMLDLMTTVAGENEVLPDLEAALWVRSEVVRQLPLNQRERKAGCRNFYWKTFTSC